MDLKNWAKNQGRTGRGKGTLYGNFFDNEVDRLKIDLGNINTRGTVNKEVFYTRIAQAITSTEIIEMTTLRKGCDNIYQYMQRVEEYPGLSLLYLIALGIARESDITTYLTLKGQEGIDITKVVKKGSETKLDTKYVMEIESKRREIPTLRNIHGKELPEPTKDVGSYLAALDKIEKKQKEKEEATLEMPEEHVTMEMELPEEASVDYVDTLEDVEEEEVDDYLKELTKVLGAEVSEDEIQQEKVEAAKLEMKKVRVVYLLGEGLEVPEEIEGYQFKVVKAMRDVSMFTSNKNNLLVLSKRVDKKLIGAMRKWLLEVKKIQKEQKRFRIVTVEGPYASKQEIIEEEINLTKDGLELYYAKHPVTEYMGEGLGDLTVVSFGE